MKPLVKRIRAGKYKANNHGYIFTIQNNHEGKWILSNHSGVEIYRDESKQAIVLMLSSYSVNGTQLLHQQQFCKYS